MDWQESVFTATRRPPAGGGILDQYQAVTAEVYVDGAQPTNGAFDCPSPVLPGTSCNATCADGFRGTPSSTRQTDRMRSGGSGMDSESDSAADGGAGNGYGEGPSNVLWLHGLPLSAQEEDIVSWFEDRQITPLLPDNVHIITDYGHPTGEALVEFASPQDAQAAGAKDKQMMGTHYIEVFAGSRDELLLYSF